MKMTLKKKYRTYSERTQYSYGRRHNGNGRHGITTPEVMSLRGQATKNLNPTPKTMVVDGLTGRSVMV